MYFFLALMKLYRYKKLEKEDIFFLLSDLNYSRVVSKFTESQM